ncbi:MAG: hypothetical protein U9O98_11350 [Asgard group archaeon]|nr:hypothetical protein [Asgard group archaeon]
MIARNDGRCVYYLSDNDCYDPQLISGYLASLIIFMKTHHNQTPLGITLKDGQWIFTHDEKGSFFIAASIRTKNDIDEIFIREAMNDIMKSIHIIAGHQTIPILEEESQIKMILDQMIKDKLSNITGKDRINKYKPGILVTGSTI